MYCGITFSAVVTQGRCCIGCCEHGAVVDPNSRIIEGHSHVPCSSTRKIRTNTGPCYHEKFLTLGTPRIPASLDQWTGYQRQLENREVSENEECIIP
jgi:hypothetical protein